MKRLPKAATIGIALLAAWLWAAAPARADVGDILWQVQRGTGFEASPAILGDGTLYIGSDDGRLYAFDRDGGEQWGFATGAAVTASPAVGADGTIYVGSADGFLYAVDPGGGQKWRYPTGAGIFSSPAIGPDGTVYFGSDDSFVYALEDTDSEAILRWRFRTSGAVRSSPAFDRNGTLYVGADDDHLYALSTDGDLKWRYLTGGDIRSSPAVGDDGTVYAGSDDGSLHAVTDAGTEGQRKWRFETGGRVRSSAAVLSDGVVYVGSDDGFLYAIRDDGIDRTLEWEFETLGAVQSSPAIGSGGRIYFSSLDGFLYALDEDGEAAWSVLLSESSGSPVIARDGTLYIGTLASVSNGVFLNGPLYAVETDADGILHGAPWPMFLHDVRHTGRNTANEAPQADAGGDQQAGGGQRVTLDGSGSTDPDYGIARFRWRQTSGDTVTISGEDEIAMSFVAPNVDTTDPLAFELTVTDNGGLTSMETASVSIEKDDSFCFIGTAAEGFLPTID
jgi:outer membrane protein assembly factor BamB